MSEHQAAGGHTSCCKITRPYDYSGSYVHLTAKQKVRSQTSSVGLLMDEMALGQGFSPYIYAFSCQYYSTNSPYSFILSFIHSCIYYFLYSFIHLSIHPAIQPSRHAFFVHHQYYVGSLLYRIIK